MNVSVFGLGYVGTVTAACLAARGHRVIGVDTEPGKVATINSARSPVIEPGLDELLAQAVGTGALRATDSVREAVRASELSLVCVGTPSAPGGRTDLAQVRGVVADIGAVLAELDRPHTVVIRSTVPPGTVDEVVVPLLAASFGRPAGGSSPGVAMCPEFLREGSGVADFFDPPFLVIGGAPGATTAVRELFGFLDCAVYAVSTRTAESIKYACNAFHALKVSFANELARLYRVLEVDSREVMEVFVQDRLLNISPAYLRPGFAFGGSCLPKDLRSLLYLGRMNCVDLPLLEATLASNEMLVRQVADRVLHAVDGGGVGGVGSVGGGHGIESTGSAVRPPADPADPANRRVALLGLSFKQHTDDLRESPNVALAEILLGKGLDVRIHDAVVNPARLTGANLRYVRSRLPHLHRVLVEDPAQALAGAAVAVVSTTSRDVLAAVRAANPPVVLDLNGMLGADLEALPGYQGVGW